MALNKGTPPVSTSHIAGTAPAPDTDTALAQALAAAKQREQQASAPAPQQQAPVIQPTSPIYNQPQTANQQRRTNMNTPQRRTISGFREYNPSAVSGLPVAEAVARFIDSAKKIAEGNQNKDYTTDILTLQRGESSVYVSSVIFVVRNPAQPEAGLAYHTLLLADTADDPTPLTTQIGGQQVEVFRTMGDAYNNTYRAAIAQLLRSRYPNVDTNNMYDAEAEIVPKGFDYADTALVRRSLMNASEAACTMLNTSEDKFVDLNLADLGGQSNTQVRLAFNQPESSNDVGEPVRTDVVITFSEISGQPNQQYKPGEMPDLNTSEPTTRLAEIGGFLDLMWNPSGQLQSNNPYAQYGQPTAVAQQMPYLYQPRFVITKADMLPGLTTLTAQLMSIITVLQLRENNNWMGGFHRPHGAEADTRDIGAIGIEANVQGNPNGIGTRFDTRADSFKPAQLAQLLSAFVRPELVISMDVEECGPTTWQSSVFLAAAKGSHEANGAIQSAANLLTNGEFAKLYNGPVVLDDNNRIHLGWYMDGSGRRHDLRDIDYLCILNMLGERDPQAARDWSDTFARIDYPYEQRMAVRKKILQAVINDPHITGFAQRITFHPDFLYNLAVGAANVGLQIRTITPYQDLAGQPRAAATWLQNAGLGARPVPVFNRGFNPQVGVAPGVAGFGRWGN